MPLPVLFVLLVAIAIYWFITQIKPEQERVSLLRPGLADGLLTHLNERRHDLGLPVLEMDDDLMMVAEKKATHQVLTGSHEDGWEYPREFTRMFGRSLLLEALLVGSPSSMVERIANHKDSFDGEWVRCGIGVANRARGEVVVAFILCRVPWEPLAQPGGQRSLVERLIS